MWPSEGKRGLGSAAAEAATVVATAVAATITTTTFAARRILIPSSPRWDTQPAATPRAVCFSSDYERDSTSSFLASACQPIKFARSWRNEAAEASAKTKMPYHAMGVAK